MCGWVRASTILLIFPAVFMLFSRTAHAYVDPGTGSYVLQMIVAGIAATGLTVRLFWGRLKSYLKKSSDRTSGESGSRRENE